MSAFDDLAADDVDLLTASETVPRSILAEVVGYVDAMQPVVNAAIALVEAETKPPLVGVASRDQPWTQARAKLAAAVEAFRLGQGEKPE
jgi:hypothetical protein